MIEQSLPEHKTKKDLVVEVLRRAILSGDLQPGERLRQNELAERFQVSATPVREALVELEKEGLLVHTAHKGANVADSTVEDVKGVFLIRALLEGLATELAVPNLDPKGIAQLRTLHQESSRLTSENDLRELSDLNREFHTVIYQACGSRLLHDTINFVWARMPWRDDWQDIPGRAQQVVDEHARILAMVEKGRAKEAAHFMSEHLHEGGQRLFTLVAKARSGQPEKVKRANVSGQSE